MSVGDEDSEKVRPLIEQLQDKDKEITIMSSQFTVPDEWHLISGNPKLAKITLAGWGDWDLDFHVRMATTESQRK